MSDDMTPERAMEIVDQIQGPDGIAALEEELQKAADNRMRQITALTGEINAFKTTKRMLQALRNRWGLPHAMLKPPASTPSSPEASAPPATAPAPDKALKERIAKGLCTFKAFKTKKWCRRKLKTKAEKECGYCRIHMDELGIGG